MADGISAVNFDTKPIQAALRDRAARMDRATMYGIRAVGRVVKQESSRRAREHKKTGTLARSIKSDRKLGRDGLAYTVKVGPRGTVTASDTGATKGVPLYRGKIEGLYGYMAGGYAAAVGRMEATLAKAWGTVWSR